MVQSKINLLLLLLSELKARNKVDSGLLDRPKEAVGQIWLSKSTSIIEKLCRKKRILWTIGLCTFPNENGSITPRKYDQSIIVAPDLTAV
jgi:putative exporter of polyketide antibiotics